MKTIHLDKSFRVDHPDERNVDHQGVAFLSALGLDPMNVQRQLAPISAEGDTVSLKIFRLEPDPESGGLRRAVCHPADRQEGRPCTCQPLHPGLEAGLQRDTITVPLTVDPTDYGLLVSA